MLNKDSCAVNEKEMRVSASVCWCSAASVGMSIYKGALLTQSAIRFTKLRRHSVEIAFSRIRPRARVTSGMGGIRSQEAQAQNETQLPGYVSKHTRSKSVMLLLGLAAIK